MDNLSKQFSVILLITIFIGLIIIEPLVNVSSESSSIVIIDARGSTVVLDSVPKRVVSLAPSITEIIFALSKQDYLIGVDAVSYNDPHYGISSYVREKNITNVGGYWWTLIDIQSIINLNPDLVIADLGAHKPLIDTFNEYGLKTIYLYGGSARSIEEVYSDILIVGKVFNNTDAAFELVNRIKSEFNKYSKILESFYSTRLLFIISLNGGIWVAGRETFINDAMSKLGIENAVNKTGWVLLSIEEIYRLEPDAILVASMFDYEYTLKKIEEYDLYSVTPRIYVLKPIETDYFLRPGPLVINIPKLIYSILEYWGLRKPPPISEYNYLPVITLAIFIVILVIKRISKH